MGDFGGFIGLILRGITVVSYQGSYVFVIFSFVQKLYYSKKVNVTKDGQIIHYDRVEFDFKQMWQQVPILNMFRKYIKMNDEKAC